MPDSRLDIIPANGSLIFSLGEGVVKSIDKRANRPMATCPKWPTILDTPPSKCKVEKCSRRSRKSKLLLAIMTVSEQLLMDSKHMAKQAPAAMLS